MTVGETSAGDASADAAIFMMGSVLDPKRKGIDSFVSDKSGSVSGEQSAYEMPAICEYVEVDDLRALKKTFPQENSVDGGGNRPAPESQNLYIECDGRVVAFVTADFSEAAYEEYDDVFDAMISSIRIDRSLAGSSALTSQNEANGWAPTEGDPIITGADGRTWGSFDPTTDDATQICAGEARKAVGRYMFQELFTPKGVELDQLTGWRKVLTNPWVATIITVGVGVGLGMTGYQLVWPLFGAANQLLAALGLLAVCAWLGNAGRNNKMFYFPMAFMLVVTLTSLALSVQGKVVAIAAGAITLANVLQLVIAVLLMVLAVVLAVKGVKVIFGKKKPEAA